MRITVEVTQAELDEMGVENKQDLECEMYDSLDNSGEYEMSGYNIYIKVVEEEVI